METRVSISIPQVAATAHLDIEGVAVPVFIGDEEYATAEALVAWGDLVDELVDDPEVSATYLEELSVALSAAAAELWDAARNR